MDKLIEIAKANGALPLPVSRNDQQYIFTADQLCATVEQIYEQRLKQLESELAINVECSVYEDFVLPTIAAHRALIGDKE